MKHTCEKCSMDATFLKPDEQGLVHYFCDHHKPEGATRIGTVAKKNTFKKFLPIIAIFSVIAIFTVVATFLHGFTWEFAMRMMMGSFFLIFGLFKVFNLKAFADAYGTYDILAMRSRTYAYIYPFLELLLAVLYFANLGGIARDVFTFLLMAISSIGVIRKLRDKEDIPCACLGMVFKLPMTKVTLFEDVLMTFEALVMIIIAIK